MAAPTQVAYKMTTTAKVGSQTDRAWVRRWRKAWGIRNLSAFYVLIVIVVIFGSTLPNLFLTSQNLKSILYQQAVTALIALAFVIPLAAGVYDLSVAYTMGVCSAMVAWFMANGGLPMWVAIAAAIAVGIGIGLVNALVILVLRIDSLIATLATSSILLAAGNTLNSGQPILKLPASFGRLTSTKLAGIAMPFWYLLMVGLVLWFVLQYTPTGRYIYATGGGADAARLAGVKTNRVVIIVLAGAGAIAAIAGVILTSRVGAGQASNGPPYLLTAIAGAFLGATQVKAGTFNVWGTIFATYVLAIGVNGVQLAGAPSWVSDVFTGVALIVAVGLAGFERRLRPVKGLRTQSALGADPPAEVPTATPT